MEISVEDPFHWHERMTVFGKKDLAPERPERWRWRPTNANITKGQYWRDLEGWPWAAPRRAAPDSCIPAGVEAPPARMHTETDLETILLGPVLADRACGDCVACCTVLTVDTPDFKKPAGTPCTHLSSRGCSVHAVRPQICRTWFCAWRRIAGLPDEARPDRSGLLVTLNFVREPRNCFEGVSINVRTLAGRDAIESGMVVTILDSLCDQLVAVWFSDGSKKMLMHPENEVASLVISGDLAPAHLTDEVAAWRERYGVFAANS